MAAQNMDTKTYSAMSSGEAYATYRKTIPAQIAVKYINPFSGNPDEMILTGDGEDALIDVWNVKEDLYLTRLNRHHFEVGNLVKFDKNSVVPEPVEETLAQATDVELRDIVNLKGFAFTGALKKIEEEAVLFRLLETAQTEEKSDRVVTAIKARLSEVQSQRPATV
jgi:hypothetical protein